MEFLAYPDPPSIIWDDDHGMIRHIKRDQARRLSLLHPDPPIPSRPPNRRERRTRTALTRKGE